MMNDMTLLLGQPVSDPHVSSLLSHIGIAQPLASPQPDESYTGVESEAHGIGINVARAEDIDLPAADELPEGTLAVSTIFMFAEGEQGHTQFQGLLPEGLKFSMSRDEVRALLGAPQWSSPVLPIDRWHKDRYRLVVDFDNAETIRLVSIGLPKQDN
jgi:hypothetical protein